MASSPVFVAAPPMMQAALRCRIPGPVKPDFGRERAPAVGFALYVSETDRIPAASAILVSRPQASRLMGRRAASGLLGNAGDSSAGHLTC